MEYPIKPVSFKGKYYKRFGNANHIISLQDAVDLHLQSINTSWDYYPDPNINLDSIDMDKVNDFIKLLEKRKGIIINDDIITVLRKYELINKDNKPNFACSLLFKKYIGATNKIILAKFQGKDKTISKDDLIIEDSLIFEVDKVLDFIKKNINKGIILKSGDSVNTEVWDYPLEAIREIVINAIVHKDYRATPNIQIYIFDDRIEISNPGKLPEGMSIEGIKAGIYKSNSPNKLVAKIFKELGIIEEYGSGVNKIMKFFKKANLEEPIIDISQGFVTYIAYKKIQEND